MSGLTPQHLPVLARGAHNDPADGACLMEYVSLLAGESFSDRPSCTHPLLAQVARLVNDISPDSSRQGLVALAPGLIGTGDDDLRMAPALVICCGEVGLDAHPSAWRLRRHVRRARRRLERMEQAGPGSWARVSDAAYQYGSAAPAIGHTLTAIARLPMGQREEELRRLLGEASTVCGRYRRSPAGASVAESPQAVSADRAEVG